MKFIALTIAAFGVLSAPAPAAAAQASLRIPGVNVPVAPSSAMALPEAAAPSGPQASSLPVAKAAPSVLVLDVGGTHVKALVTGKRTPVKIESGPTMTAARMAREIKEATQGWDYQAVAIGYPGPIKDGRPAADPANLGPGWKNFDYRKAFGKPVKIVNDAAMQALGSYQGGRMLFLGLGTGLGSALIVDGQLQPLELAHLPYKKGKTYEDYVGLRGLEKYGKKKWRKSVFDVVERLKAAFQVDYVVLGGGNVKQLKRLPLGARAGNNANAFTGGFRLWKPAAGR